jgi:hypothetical protein
MAQVVGNRTILTITEAGDKYHLSPSYLGLLARNHQIESFKMGLMWLIYEDSLCQFLAHPRKPGPKPKNSSSTSKNTMAQKSGEEQ